MAESPAVVGDLPQDPPPERQRQVSQSEQVLAPSLRRRGGYDCEFVERASGGVDSEPQDTQCPVCSLVLREPHQVTCCGYTFCYDCVHAIQSGPRSCPFCKQENFTAFADKRLKRSLYVRRVRCSKLRSGCEWEGKLAELDEHLNLQPSLENKLDGCQFTEVECNYCFQPYERCHLKSHQLGICPKRRYTCEHCKEHEATFEDVTLNHWPVCPSFPLSCPNNCEAVVKRQELENHVKQDCSLALVDCDFNMVGCLVRLPKKDLPAHISANLPDHVYAQQKMLIDLQKQVAQYKRENEELQQALVASEQKVRATLLAHQRKLEELSFSGTLPIEFVMDNFEEHKRAGDNWRSPAFFTHRRGYRMSLVVHADGCYEGKGTHISVTARLMRGRFDDSLSWPFFGSLSIEILNQLGDQRHHVKCYNFSQVPDLKQNGRVMSGEYAQSGPCIVKFIPHARLGLNADRNCLYLYNNTLKFKVLKATDLDPSVHLLKRLATLESFARTVELKACIAPIEFTVVKFEEQMRKNSVWFSPGFYTHYRGYKMCLRVDPNGQGNATGTHVSIFVCMMQGPFDAQLKWPFCGSISVEIVNQFCDSNHHVQIIPFDSNTGVQSAKRVIDKDRASGHGLPYFLPHRLLSYNESRGTQYLRGDYLRVRISIAKRK